MIAELLVDTTCDLGESPTWQRRLGRLLWLDIDGQILHALDEAGTHTETRLDRRITCVAARHGGGLVGATGEWIVTLDDHGTVTGTVAQIPDGAELGTNDGRCDPGGNLWVGTVDRSGGERGGLYRVGADGDVTLMGGGIGLSNGIDWSPAGDRAYYVDSFTRRVDVLELDDDGVLEVRRPLVSVDAIPDGLTVDAEGGIWLALWDGGGVHRYTPEGLLDQVVGIPGGFVTSCAFGEGRWSTTLFVTTASTGLEPGAERWDGAGALYAVDVGVGGRGYTEFGAGGSPG